MEFSENKLEMIEIYRENPSAAARDLLGIDLAPHQRAILKAMWDCNNVIIILNRGAGKCERYKNLIQTREGFKKIGDICTENSTNMGFSDYNKEVRGENGFKNATCTYINDAKPIYNIITDFGYEKGAVDKHIIRVFENGIIKWKRFDEIKVGDYTVIERDDYRFLGNNKDTDTSYMIGCLIGDGNLTQGSYIGFTNFDDDIVNEFKRCVDSSGFGEFRRRKRAGQFAISFPSTEYGVKNAGCKEFLRIHGLNPVTSHFKEIPSSILQSSNGTLAAFLSGLFDTDGSVTKRGIEISSASELLIEQTQVVLLSYGIVSKRRKKMVKYKDSRRAYWILTIESGNLDLFYHKIGFRCKRKQEKLKLLLGKTRNQNKDIIPDISSFLLDVRARFLSDKTEYKLDNNTRRLLQMTHIKKYNVSYRWLGDFLSLTKGIKCESYNILKDIYDRHYFFDSVKTIEILPDEVTYDFSIPDGHSFISNGFISHNTFIDAVFAILRALLFPGEKVGIFSSSYRQCLQFGGNNIFTNNGMINTSEIFRDDITHIQSNDESNKILNKWMNNDSDGYEIKTSSMYSFSVKNGHRILVSTENGIEYKNINDIVVGDVLPIRIGFNYFGEKVDLPNDDYVVTGYDNHIKIPTKITKDFAYFLGLICGDGCITKSKSDKNYRISLVSGDDELGEKYLRIMRDIFDITNVSVGRKKNSNGKDGKCKYYNVNSKHLYKFLEKCGLSNCGALNKSIPDVIKSAPKKYVCEFLKGLFDTDGFASFSDKKSNSIMIGLSTSSKKMAEEVRDMLLNIGIFSKITESTKQGKKEIIKGKTSNISTGYRVYISSAKYISKYMNEISFSLSRKRAFVESNIKYGSRWCDRMIYPKNVMDALKKKIMDKYGKKVGAGYFYKSLGQIQSKYITPERINLFLDLIIKFNCDIKEIDEYNLLKNMYKNDYAFVEVMDKNSKIVKTFDIEVENEHCYWAGGFIHHNSKFVFAEVEKIYDISPILRDSCEKKPTKMVDMCYLQFKSTGNRPGSVIHCLPLGDGSTIRGARYFTIIADEAAQIPAEIFDVVVRGMMATSKNPMEQVRALEEQKKLLAEGKIDKIKNLHNNKMVMSSTAYYQYNHLWKRVKSYIDIILEKVEKQQRLKKQGKEIPEELNVELRGHDLNSQIPFNIMKDQDRALIAFSCEDMPEGFMNTESIKEAEREMPRYQWLMEYFCFLENTKILTDRGIKRIKDIKIGDYVLTHNGRFRKVVNTMFREYSGNIIQYRTYGDFEDVCVTDKHRYFKNNGWKEIGSFNKGEYLFQSTLKELNNKKDIDIVDYIDVNFLKSDIDGEKYIYPLTGKSKLNSGDIGTNSLFKSSVKRNIKIDRNLGLVFGWYASEGSGGSNGKQISFSLDSHIDRGIDSFSQELKDAIFSSFGIVAKEFNTKDNTKNILINSNILYSFIKRICPGVSHDKKIDPEILFSNEEFLLGFITGYWHGDGCINDKPQAIAGCVNLDLLSQIKLAISYFNIPSSIRKQKTKQDCFFRGKKCETKDVYYLEIKGDNCRIFDNLINNKENEVLLSKYSNNYIKNDIDNLFKIKSFENKEYSGLVYNFSVEDDESYSLVTSTVHNCLFPSDSDGFFPMSLLDKARTHGEFTCPMSLEKSDEWVNIMGCDPARSGDNFGIAIFRANIKTGEIRLVRVFSYNKQSYPFMHEEIRRLRKLFNISEISMDSGGGGQTIRDLLANKKNCPPGDDIILQRDFDEHMLKKGKRILRLVEFSKYEWVHDANNNLLLALQNGSLKIACEKGSLKHGNDFDENMLEEEARKEIEKTLEEIQNIVVTRTPTGRQHWDTPQKNQRKDRYSAVLIGYDQAYSYIENLHKPQTLATGFWAK